MQDPVATPNFEKGKFRVAQGLLDLAQCAARPDVDATVLVQMIAFAYVASRDGHTNRPIVNS